MVGKMSGPRDSDTRMQKEERREEKRLKEPMALLHAPLFLSGSQVPKGWTGEFYVNSQLRTTLTSPLLAGDADVFYGIMDLLVQQGATDRRVAFGTRAFLGEIGWNMGGRGYAELRASVERLFDASVRVEGLTVDGEEIEGKFRLISSSYWHRKKPANKPRQVWVMVSDEVLKLAQDPRGLKAIHRGKYRSLSTRLSKRLMELIAVKASDLVSWKARVFSIRDLVPLVGDSYRYPSKVKLALAPALDELLAEKLIVAYRFLVEGEHFLEVEPNPEYFDFSPARLRARDAAKTGPQAPGEAAPPPLSPLAAELERRGLDRDLAARLAAERPNMVKAQIEHYDAMRQAGKAKGVGWLRTAIEKGYSVPAGFETKEESARKAEESKARAEAQRHYEEAERNLARAAMAKDQKQRTAYLEAAIASGEAGGGELGLEAAAKAKEELSRDAMAEFEKNLGENDLAEVEKQALDELATCRGLLPEGTEKLRVHPVFVGKRAEIIAKLAAKMQIPS